MQLSLSLDPHSYYKNRGIFADHYLKSSERLQALDEWKHATGADEAFRKITQLYNQRASRFNKRTNEAQTENDFIRPVLNLLWGEDCYQVQVIILNVDASRQPDYAFFSTAKERQDAESLKGTLDYFRDVSVLGDAKAWFASLDKQRGMDENPSAQICNYLYRSRMRWGILTNGRIWRLYERDKSSAGGIFYEVNLEDILQHGDLEAFKYFYLFFRRESFLPDQNGVSFIEKVFQGSVNYATKVSDHLKESVYDALRHLMNGFIAHPANGLDSKDSHTMKLVHENCLIILYRLLFVLYAEDRNLLPCEDELYKNYSLRKLHKEINQNLRAHHPYLPNTATIWSQVCNLFALIDEGFKDRNRIIIPAYNGGLFSPFKYPHITHTITHDSGVRRWNIGDRYLAEVIDMLAYERNRWNEAGIRDVDYATLDVQHLGSIYEGLLELQPHIAEEPLVETLEDGKSVFKPTRDVPNPRPIHGQPPRTINSGEIYLVTNRGERKATGSYYTPKYIVDYIVENTIGPLAEEVAKKVAELHSEVVKEIGKLERKRREWAKLKQKGTEASKISEHIEGLTSRIEQQKRRLLEPYLSLKICDPAMGSGHFLVGAADFLSLAMATDPNLLPLDEMGTEDPQSFYKRLIVERCLYGVDLNPLAVELAKLSLWLHMVSKEKALSFLDHHLRCGNSLIGARVEDDLRKEPPIFNARGRRTNADSQQLMIGFTETLTATHLQHFLDTFREIMETPSGDAEMERKKDELYRAMDKVRDKFRAVANCWLAPYFDVPVTAMQYEKAIRTLRGTDIDWRGLTQETWFQDSQAVAHQKRFFHWELEFPEIFFDANGFKLKEERGFDVVIGNPPYGLIIDLGTKLLVQQTFVSSQYQLDNYVAFMERAHMLRQQGYQSFIVPTTFLTMHYFSSIRRLLLDNYCILTIVHFKFPVFEDPTVESALYICQNEPDYNKRLGNTVNGGVVKELGEFMSKRFEVQSVSQTMFEKMPENDFNFSIVAEASIVQKIQNSKVEPLDKLCDMTVGIKPYQVGKGNPKQTRETVEERVFDATYRRDTTYRQYLMGRDINRYIVEPLEERWISYGEWLAEPRPAAPFFEPKRILVRQTGDSIIATLEDKQRLTLNNIHNLLLKSEPPMYEYLLAILNSWLITYFHQQVVPEANRVFAEVKIVDLERLPIRRIAFTTSESERTQLLDKSKKLYERCLSKDDNDCVLGFVEHQLAQTPEHMDVIHDFLAFLAEQMIEMNKQKQAEVKGFLTWLERYIGAKIDDLRNKTKLRAYHEYDFNTLLDVLRKNHRHLTINPETRSVQESIESEFKASMEKLKPLKTRIAATDRLIDLIVYRLYGLTEEEIAIVERSISDTTSKANKSDED